MTDVPCMGGWCLSRVGCANYHLTGPEPAERLCPKGQDYPEPIKPPAAARPRAFQDPNAQEAV